MCTCKLAPRQTSRLRKFQMIGFCFYCSELEYSYQLPISEKWETLWPFKCHLGFACLVFQSFSIRVELSKKRLFKLIYLKHWHLGNEFIITLATGVNKELSILSILFRKLNGKHLMFLTQWDSPTLYWGWLRGGIVLIDRSSMLGWYQLSSSCFSSGGGLGSQSALHSVIAHRILLVIFAKNRFLICFPG